MTVQNSIDHFIILTFLIFIPEQLGFYSHSIRGIIFVQDNSFHAFVDFNDVLSENAFHDSLLLLGGKVLLGFIDHFCDYRF